MNSKIIDAMLETAKDLGLSQITIKEIELLNIEEVKAMDSKKIVNIQHMDFNVQLLNPINET
ncbi:MAG: hypothetical protein QM752_03235 [Gammaproteobacteria bacterium]